METGVRCAHLDGSEREEERKEGGRGNGPGVQ